MVVLGAVVVLAGLGLLDDQRRQQDASQLRVEVAAAQQAVDRADARLLAVLQQSPPVRFAPRTPAYEVLPDAAADLRAAAREGAREVRSARSALARTAAQAQDAKVAAVGTTFVGYLDELLDHLDAVGSDVLAVYHSDAHLILARRRAQAALEGLG